MKRDERILVAAAGAVVGAFAAIFLGGLENDLAAHAWWSNGANVIQWISGPATVAAVAAFVYHRLVRRCAVPLCVRSGEHPVDGTLSKVCTHHHTREHHELVHRIGGELHLLSGRLGWGESHNPTRPTPTPIPIDEVSVRIRPFAGKKPDPRRPEPPEPDYETKKPAPPADPSNRRKRR